MNIKTHTKLPSTGDYILVTATEEELRKTFVNSEVSTGEIHKVISRGLANICLEGDGGRFLRHDMYVKVGDMVEVTASEEELRGISVDVGVRTGSVLRIKAICALDVELEGRPGRYMLPRFVRKPITKVTKAKTKVNAAKTRTQYSVAFKQLIVQEYLNLPLDSAGRRKGLKQLAERNKMSVRTINGATGFLSQYKNGGWDVAYAIAFSRRGNATVRTQVSTKRSK